MASLIATTLTIMALPYLLSGIRVDGLGSAAGAAIVLGIANAVIRPILSFLAFPLTFLTLGLFSFVISGAMIILTSKFVSGFNVDGLWSAIIAAVIVSLVNGFLT